MITNEELNNLDKETLIKLINYQKRAFDYKSKQVNFFQLYIMLLEKQISEAEYDKEIEDNPDKYAVSPGRQIDEDELRFCLWLVKTGLFGDKVEDEFYELFDLSELSVNEICKKFEQ